MAAGVSAGLAALDDFLLSLLGFEAQSTVVRQVLAALNEQDESMTDSLTTRALRCASAAVGSDEVSVHREFGGFFVTWALRHSGHLSELLENQAHDFVEFVCSLNDLFWLLGDALPDLDWPLLEVQEVGHTLLIMDVQNHPTSRSVAWVEGFIHKASSSLFNTQATVRFHTSVGSKPAQMHVNYPPTCKRRLQQLKRYCVKDMSGDKLCSFDPSVFQSAPFSLVLDTHHSVVGAGHTLTHLVPELQKSGTLASSQFDIQFPRIQWSTRQLLCAARTGAKFVLRHRESGLVLSGKLTCSRMQARDSASTSDDLLLTFVGTPYIFSFRDLKDHDLRLTDLWTHGLMAESILIRDVLDSQLGGGAAMGEVPSTLCAAVSSLCVRAEHVMDRMQSSLPADVAEEVRSLRSMARAIQMKLAQHGHGQSNTSGQEVHRNTGESSLASLETDVGLALGQLLGVSRKNQNKDNNSKWMLGGIMTGDDHASGSVSRPPATPCEERGTSASMTRTTGPQQRMSHASRAGSQLQNIPVFEKRSLVSNPSSVTLMYFDIFQHAKHLPVDEEPVEHASNTNLGFRTCDNPLANTERSTVPEAMSTYNFLHVEARPGGITWRGLCTKLGSMLSGCLFSRAAGAPDQPITSPECSAIQQSPCHRKLERASEHLGPTQNVRPSGALTGLKQSASCGSSSSSSLQLQRPQQRPASRLRKLSQPYSTLSLQQTDSLRSNLQLTGPAGACPDSSCARLAVADLQHGAPKRRSGIVAMGHLGAQALEVGGTGHGSERDAQRVPREQTLPSFVLLKEPSDGLSKVLELVDEWQFDMFQLEDITGGHSLSVLGFHLMKAGGLVAGLQLSEKRLARYLLRIEEGYPQMMYHCRAHAADVLRSLHVLLTRGGVLKAITSQPIDGDAADVSEDGCTSSAAATASLLAQRQCMFKRCACYMSAIIHDFEHQGVNNDFLIRTAHPLALLYNDKSPQENHHVAAACQLLQDQQYNFLPSGSNAMLTQLREMMIELVLATDMKAHFSLCSAFGEAVMEPLVAQARLSAACTLTRGTHFINGSISRAVSVHNSIISPRSSPKQEENDKHQTASSSSFAETVLRQQTASRYVSAASGFEPVPAQELTEAAKTLALQVSLKCADLGHMGSREDVHMKWVHMLEEEMFSQGNSEAFLGVNISPLMDRKKAGVSKSQCGFFKVVVIPMFTSFVQVFPETAPILANLMANYEMWQKMEVAASVAEALSAKPEASRTVDTNATRAVLSAAPSTDLVED